ncbi:MAG: anti-sigma factor antagonist [Clostridia bacterium]|nr:anti-sigma factor antagonist [Clostridia bacterium]
MKHTLTDDKLTLFLAGRIDSANAAETEAEVQQICEAETFTSIVLDMDELEYISSAGLRIVLRLLKAHPGLTVVNVSAEVYEILEMTGFTEMLPVTKAYRKLSVDGCEIIGKGANGTVYRWDRDTILKVYHNPDSLPDIQRERELARKAFVLGVPTAIPYDVVRVGDSYGTVFELLNAEVFAQKLNKEPEWLDECAHRLVDLLKIIHGTVVKPEDMPDQKAVTLGWAKFLKDYLPADQYEKLYALIDAIPEDHHMMHGDYHAKNVMLQNGESLLIDMDTLCQGHPVFEFASIFLAYQGFHEPTPPEFIDFMGLPYAACRELLHRIMKYYFNVEDEAAYNHILDKARVIGYTRLMRRTIRRDPDSEAGKALIAHCAAQLAILLNTVDSLTF